MLLGTVVKDAATALVSPTLMRTTMFNLGRYKLFASDQTYSASAIALVQRSTVIDMAASTMGSLSDEEKMIGHPENFTPEDFMPYTSTFSSPSLATIGSSLDKQSGINVFHIARGFGGADAYMTPGSNAWTLPPASTQSGLQAKSAFFSVFKMLSISANSTMWIISTASASESPNSPTTNAT